MHTKDLTVIELEQLEQLALGDQVHESAGMALVQHVVRQDLVRRHESRPGPRTAPPQVPPVPALADWTLDDLITAQADILEICRDHHQTRLRSFALDLAAELRAELRRRLLVLAGEPAESAHPADDEKAATIDRSEQASDERRGP